MRSSGFFNHFMKMRLPYFIMSSIDFFATIRTEQLNTGDRQKYEKYFTRIFVEVLQEFNAQLVLILQ